MKTTKLCSGSRLVMTALAITGLSFSSPTVFAVEKETKPASEDRKAEPQKGEPKSEQTKAVNPEVQSEVEKKTAEKRGQLLKDAQSAIEETNKAVEALDKGNKDK